MDALKFAVSLEDHISPSSTAAGKALKHLQTELKSSKTALAQYQSQLQHAKNLGDVEGHRKYTSLVEQARRQTFDLQDAVLGMGHAAESSAGSVGGLAKAMGPYAAAVTAGIAATVGLGLALADLVKRGVETALEVSAVNERLTGSFEALGDKAGAGTKTLAFLNHLSSKLPQSRDELAKWTKQFEAFGITDLGELRQQIKATAAAQAIMGDEGASAYQMLAERIKDAAQGRHQLKLGRDPLKMIAESGVSATAVAERLGMTLQQFDAKLKGGTVDATAFGNALSSALIAKGKAPLAAMSSELGTLRAKATETWNHLFDGIDTSPLTNVLKTIISIGDQGKPSGQALHTGISTGIQGIINWLGKMGTEATVVFLQLELFAVTHTKQLKGLGAEFRAVGDAIVFAAHAVEELISVAQDPGGHLSAIIKGTAALGTWANVRGHTTAPAHAQGGMVHRPAAGEFFASVAPGEMILPQRQTRELISGGIGAGGRSLFQPYTPANTNARGGSGVHIERLDLTIQAPNGVTDATSLSATGLVLALERLQLASGR